MSAAIPRSFLYVPADASDRLPKAAASAADALIIDLEDAVLPARKAAARESLRAWLLASNVRGKQLWIRINDGDDAEADLEAIADVPRLDGIVIAKASVASVRRVGRWLDDAGLDLALSPLIETADSVLRASVIATLPRVEHLQIGEVDLADDLGLPSPVANEALLFTRSQVVMASAAADLAAPIAPVSVEVRDATSFEASTRRLAALGFVGRACIHPAQVAIANAVFTPSPERIGEARDVLADFDVAIAGGAGAMLDRNGRLVDEAVVRTARRTLELVDD